MNAGPTNANSGLHRFAGGFQPYSPPTYTPQNFAAPTFSPMNGYASPVAPAFNVGILGRETFGGGGPTVGDPSSSPVSSTSTPSGMGSLTGPAAMGISMVTGLPVGLIGLALSQANSAADAGTSSVGVGAAPGTPGGIGVAIGGDGSEGGPGTSSSVGVGAAEGTPGGIGGIGGDGSEGTGGGGGGGGGGK